MPSYQLLPQVKTSLDFILEYYNSNNNQQQQPIIVGISGIPNIGKSTLCHTLSHIFEEEYQLNNIILSLDDEDTSLQEQITSIQYWIQNNTYSIIFIEGTILGYKPLLPNHRLWSILKKNNSTQKYQQQWEKFNQSLYTLESTLYPFIQLFIQLTPNKLDDNWQHQQQSDNKKKYHQLIMHRYYLERLNQFGFFDTSSTTSNQSRHLSLILDKDLKLIKKQKLLDGSYQQWLNDYHLQQKQQQQMILYNNNSNGNLSSSSPYHSLIKKENIYLRLLRSNSNNQLLASLHPKVLISFAMMSLLGLLGYSRRLSLIFDIINKFQQLFV